MTVPVEVVVQCRAAPGHRQRRCTTDGGVHKVRGDAAELVAIHAGDRAADRQRPGRDAGVTAGVGQVGPGAAAEGQTLPLQGRRGVAARCHTEGHALELVHRLAHRLQRDGGRSYRDHGGAS